MRFSEFSMEEYIDFMFHPIPLPVWATTYRQTYGDVMFRCTFANVLNYISINSTDTGFYDEMDGMYDDMNMSVDDRYIHFKFADDLAAFLFDYISLRPEYHTIFFLDVANVEMTPLALVVHAGFSEMGIEKYRDRTADSWSYIDASRFSFGPSPMLSPSGYF